MFEQLSAWIGTIDINGVKYNSIGEIPSNFDFSKPLCINLRGKEEKSVEKANTQSESTSMDTNKYYRVKVRQYMTRPATPDFDFMAKWNDNKPMPLRVMVGEKVKETAGMVYMILHGDITTKLTPCCMKCGKPITNPVSQYFGMGPECGSHNYTNPFDDEETLMEEVAEYRKNFLRKIRWEGWIIKKAIDEIEEVEVLDE